MHLHFPLFNIFIVTQDKCTVPVCRYVRNVISKTFLIPAPMSGAVHARDTPPARRFAAGADACTKDVFLLSNLVLFFRIRLQLAFYELKSSLGIFCAQAGCIK